MKINNKKTIRNWMIAILAMILISFGISFTSLSVLESFRIIFGSFFVLFLPGYVIVELFFKELEIIEKIALSFALSIAVVPLTVFYLNKIGMKINTLNSFLTILGIIVITIIIYLIKKAKERKKQPYHKVHHAKNRNL